MTAHQTHPHDGRPYMVTLDLQEPEKAAADEDDVRRVPIAWSELWDLVEGGKSRGLTETQMEFLRAVVGITWAKGVRFGERMAKENL